MKVTVEGAVYEYDAGKLLNTEAIALQKETGMTPTEFGEALEKGDALAITGLVWLVWRRAGRNMKLSEVEFDLMSIDIEGDEDEEGEEERPTEAVAAIAAPATPSNTDDSSTSSPSPTTSI